MAQANPYDSASKSLIRLQPHPTIAWLLGVSPDSFIFHKWENIELLGDEESDRKLDLIAIIVRKDYLGPPLGLDIEIQIDAESRMFIRLARYANMIEEQIRPSADSHDFCEANNIVINLRGRNHPRPPQTWDEANLSRGHNFKIVNLCDTPADKTLQDVTDGKAPANILGWIPLMQDGNEPSIIERWIEFVSALLDERRRSNLAALVLVFAEAADQNETWAKALKGFNTMKSAIYEEWTSGAVREDREENLGYLRNVLKRVAAQRLGNSPTHLEMIDSIDDRNRLVELLTSVSIANSWNEFLGLS